MRHRYIAVMKFADLRNDFVFRRIFASHADVLRGLLNDLLVRQGDRTIEGIEYIPPEQAPKVAVQKYSIVDVKCRDRAGTTFLVEMQLLHVAGFLNRVVYNACKSYAAQLRAGEPYTKLADVVAISICDFELWPDAESDARQQPRVPMLSRWNMTEQATGQNGLLQVQYAFLELPKLPPSEVPPRGGAELWAWLFVHTPELQEIPANLPPGPQRAAVELANEATFTQPELDAYRKVMDEIQQLRDLLLTSEAKGEAKGEAVGEARGMARAVLRVLAARGVAVSELARAQIAGCRDEATLDRWLTRAALAESTDELLAAGAT
jgi:hypothetical protein